MKRSTSNYPVAASPIENTATIAVTCAECGNPALVVCEYIGYIDWLYGYKMIQEALPNSTPAERELLLSNTCGPCYDNLFNFGDD